MSDRQKVVGTIFMGPQEERETTLERLYESARQETWTRQTEEEYMERVKVKATERVRALLVQARHRGTEIVSGAMHDAEGIRAEAEAVRAEARRALDEAEALRGEAAAQRDAGHAEGFAQGHAEVMAQLAEARKSLGEATAVVLLGIHEQCGAIFEGWRVELADLLREAVEKSTGLIVDSDRAAMLHSLLEQSMRALLDRRQYTVKVNPEDAALLTDMLADAHQASPRTANWELATDPALEPGSLVVESATALVNNSRGVRRSVVDEVLQHLILPLGQVDQDAFKTVTGHLVDGLRKNGVDFSQSGEEGGQEVSPEAPPDLSPRQEDAESGDLEPAPVQVDLSGEGEAPWPEPVPAGMPVMEETARDPLPDADIPEPVEARAGVEFPEPAAPAPTEVHEQLAQAEAQDLVEEFLGQPVIEPGAPDLSENAAGDGESPGLPPEVADDLLAEMGFGDNAGPASGR